MSRATYCVDGNVFSLLGTALDLEVKSSGLACLGDDVQYLLRISLRAHFRKQRR